MCHNVLRFSACSLGKAPSRAIAPHTLSHQRPATHIGSNHAQRRASVTTNNSAPQTKVKKTSPISLFSQGAPFSQEMRCHEPRDELEAHFASPGVRWSRQVCLAACATLCSNAKRKRWKRLIALKRALVADGHTASNTPDLFRPPQLSGAGLG